jgi:hypothetical protein
VFAPMLLWILVGVAFQLAAVIAAAALRTAGRGRALFTSQAFASALGFSALLGWIAVDDLLAPGKAYLVQTAAISVAMWIIWRRSRSVEATPRQDGHLPRKHP